MYRLNLIMRNYLDNQREIIKTHGQYLELNKIYQDNISTYINTIIRDNETVASENVNDAIFNNTYTVNTDNADNADNADNTDNTDNVEDNVVDEDTTYTGHVDTFDTSADTADTVYVHQTRTSEARRQINSSRRQLDESRQPIDTQRLLNESRERRDFNRRVRERRRLETSSPIIEPNTSPNRGVDSTHYLIPFSNAEDYSNICVPQSIISQECDIVSYNTLDNSQDLCPIDRIPYEEHEDVMRIRFCGHIFRENNLRENFRTRATCPVCRHNIITTVTNSRFRQGHNDQTSNINSAELQWFIQY